MLNTMRMLRQLCVRMSKSTAEEVDTIRVDEDSRSEHACFQVGISLNLIVSWLVYFFQSLGKKKLIFEHYLCKQWSTVS